MRNIEPEEGWFKNQSEKFKVYLGTAQRYMINRELEDLEYKAMEKTKPHPNKTTLLSEN